MGSGTCLLAAERTGRKARGFDLDAHYCSIILERWEAFSGGTAERVDG